MVKWHKINLFPSAKEKKVMDRKTTGQCFSVSVDTVQSFPTVVVSLIQTTPCVLSCPSVLQNSGNTQMLPVPGETMTTSGHSRRS